MEHLASKRPDPCADTASPPAWRGVLLAGILLGFASCAPIQVDQVPAPPPAGLAASLISGHERAWQRHISRLEVGHLLDEIAVLETQVARNDPQAIASYNYLVGRLIERLEKERLTPWRQAVTVHGPSGAWQLNGGAPRPALTAPHRLLPCDSLAFRGKHALPEPILRKGVGAPLVAVLSEPDPESLRSRSLATRYLSLTAVVRTRGRRASLELLEPDSHSRTTIAGRDCPLAKDYSSAISLALAREGQLRLFGLARTFDPQKYSDSARLSLIRNYHPQRIPVVLVHGLNDTPATWMPMYLGLMQDPEIREHFQFWIFSYPTGYPITYSALLLRRELERVTREHPNHRRMILVGHSMGGLLSRLMVTDAGQQLWLDLLGRPPAETPLPARNRKLIEQALLFDARDDIARAVFLCTPHRGSELADSPLARLAARLVRTPLLITDITTTINRLLGIDPAALGIGESPNSIYSLSPRNRTLQSLVMLPVRPSIAFHSMMGDRGKGDTPDSSDGVVTYHSAHLEGAVSEAIIPADHGAHRHPLAIAEMRRILLDHLKADSRSAASRRPGK